MFPHGFPVHGRGPTFNDHWTQNDAVSTLGNPLAQLVIIRQAISQRSEAANLAKLVAPRQHHCAQREV
jgi:hypothetical protein